MSTSTYQPVTVRAARSHDVAAISAVKAAASLPDSPAAVRDLHGAIEDANRCIVVALVDDRLVGYAKTHLWPRADGAAPAGHYLSGIAVHPGARRLGGGMLLTQARLDWIAERTDRAFYFTNARNAASLALHARWGFVELTRAAELRGVPFDGGVGVLLAAALRPTSPPAT